METPSFANLPSSFVLLKASIPVHSNTIYKWVLKPFLWTMWINDNDNDIANLTENPICLRHFLQNKHNIENKRRRCSIFGSWLYDKIWLIYLISQPLHVNYWWTGHDTLSLSISLSHMLIWHHKLFRFFTDVNWMAFVWFPSPPPCSPRTSLESEFNPLISSCSWALGSWKQIIFCVENDIMFQSGIVINILHGKIQNINHQKRSWSCF